MPANVKSVCRLVGAAILAMWMCTALWGQSMVIKHESNGTDGPLDYTGTAPGTTIYFNPLDPTQFPKPIDPAQDNVFNFTKIIIPSGVTIKLSAQYLSGPVYWLASDIVDIEGTVDLSGGAGYASTNLVSNRTPSIPGAGGFPGGVGGNGPPGSSDPAENGQGPGGGVAYCYPSNTAYAGGGGFVGSNQFLVPLIGGSGGSGSPFNGTYGYGGGAGGGAILIAGSVSIAVNGTITAAGGDPGLPNYGTGGAGAGGAIRLVAPTLTGGGHITAAPGNNSGVAVSCSIGQPGTVRLESFNQQFTGTVVGTPYSGTPYDTFAPTGGTEPRLTVAFVDNVPMPPNPLGSFNSPDVQFMSTGNVPIVINGNNIPAGTTVTLDIYSENGPDIIATGALMASGATTTTVTISVPIPAGFSRGFMSATFTPSGSPPQSPQSAKPKAK